jgi:NAD+ diphosphatase
MQERSKRSGFSNTLLDRAAERRSDAAWLAAAMENGRYLLFDGDRPLFRSVGNPTADPVFPAAAATRLEADLHRSVFLGLEGETPVFAAPVPLTGEDKERPDDLKAIDVRSIAVQGLVGPELLGPIAQAKSMLDWHARHGFCANCGAPTEMSDAGYRRHCAACGANHFPRTDPVVIMLAINGEDCLLARAPRFQPGMFSALAGFVEPGETIEEAVRREVREESGVVVDRVAYHSSQPWPFPSSLMIACFGRATTEELTLDRSEIEDGRWFSRTEVAEMLNHRHPDGVFPPPRMAIAHQLLTSFVAGETIF